MSKRCELLAVSVRSGNNVSHSNRKTRRRFLPNLQNISFRSDALGVNLTLKVAASTIRTINKYGSLDNFLVNYRYSNLSPLAQKFRNQVKKKLLAAGTLSEVKITKEKKVVAKESKRKSKKAKA